MNIKRSHFEEIINKGYSLDLVYILTLLKNQQDIVTIKNPKIQAIVNTCYRKGLITENFSLTLEGEELLKFLDSEEIKFVRKKKEETKDAFTAWWELYPSTNKFNHNGMSFNATRSFKMKKDGCRQLFNKYINEKKYTAEQIINATKFDINLKKDMSVKKRENQLTYLQNTYTYLYQESFQGFIDILQEEEIDVRSHKGPIDI